MVITDPELRHTVSELCDHQPFIERADLVLIYLADCKRYLDIYHATNAQDVRDPGTGDLLLAMMDACMLVFGYPTEQQRDRIKPNRFRQEALV